MSHSKIAAHNLFAVFDISSSSVAGAHVLATHDKSDAAALLLAAVRTDAPLREDKDVAHLVENTVHHLEDVIQRLQKADVHHPTYLQVVLASPWYSSQTRTIVYKKGTSFLCTQKLIDSLIAKEIEHVLSSEEGSFGEFGKESVIIEQQLSSVKLNGYATDKPLGKKAELLELFLTITIAPQSILSRFTDTLRRFYGPRKINYTTSPYATFIVARDTMEIAQDECMVIDVGEEVTDVAFIKDGIFLYQHSFPVGTYALYRHLAASGGHSSLEAKALLESYRLTKVTSGVTQTVSKAITAFCAEWQTALQGILDNGHYGFCIPEHCFIVADSRFETIFMDVIATDPFIQHTCSRGIVRPVFVGTSIIGTKIRAIDAMAVDTPIATAALYAEHLM